MHLGGHSDGAAVALQIALRFPQQVKSLTLYEPVAFGLLSTMAPGGPRSTRSRTSRPRWGR